MREEDEVAQTYYIFYLHKNVIRQFSSYIIFIVISHLTILSLTVQKSLRTKKTPQKIIRKKKK